MAQQIHIFSGGLDTDIELRLLAEGDYRSAVNVRIGSSQAGNKGSAENIKGNLLISNPFCEDNDFQCIGVCEDSPNNRFFFMLADLNPARKKHGIFEYNNSLRKISLIYSHPKLNFHPHNLITAVTYTNNQLFFADGTKLSTPYISGVEYNPGDKVSFGGTVYMALKSTANPTSNGTDWIVSQDPNPPRAINISDARMGLFGSFDYENNLQIDLVKIPPTHAPMFLLEKVAGENYMDKKSFQFAARYIYRDGQKSVFSSASELAVTGYKGSEISKITVGIELPGTPATFQFYKKIVKYVEFAVRDSVINPFYSIRTVDFPSPVEVLSTEITSITGALVAGSGFLANVKPGDALYEFNSGNYIGIVSVVNNNTSLTLTANAANYAGFVKSIVALQVQGKNYYSHVVFLNDENYAPIPEDLTAKDYDRVPRYTGALTFSQGRLFSGNHIEDFNTLRGTATVDNLTGTQSLETAGTTPRKIFKPGSRYQVCFQFKDYAKRRTFSYTNSKLKISAEKQVGNTYNSTYLTIPNFNDTSLPDWVASYDVLSSENLTTDWFVQGRVEQIYYASRKVDGIPVLAGPTSTTPAEVYNKVISDSFDYLANPNSNTSTNFGAANELYLDISNWLKYDNNIPYNFIEGDRLDILTTGGLVDKTATGFTDVKIKRQEGRFLVTDLPAATFYSGNQSKQSSFDLAIGGESGLVYTSGDGGLTWAKKDTKTSATIRGVITISNSVVAVGDGGFVYQDATAPNTVQWTTKDLYTVDGTTETNDPEYVAAGDGVIIWFDRFNNGGVFTGVPNKKITSLRIRRVVGTIFAATFVTEDGYYYESFLHKNTNVYEQTLATYMDDVKFNKVTVATDGFDEYSWIAGHNKLLNRGEIWLVKNAIVTPITNPQFATYPGAELTGISFYFNGNVKALYVSDANGKIYKRSADNTMSFFTFAENAGVGSTAQYFSLSTDLATPVYDLYIYESDSTPQDGIIAGAIPGAVIIKDTNNPTYQTRTFLSLFNYAAKIEVRRPRKANSQSFFYESILSSGSGVTPSRFIKRNGVNQTLEIGRVNEGDCFYIQKQFKGGKWVPKTEFIVSMTPDSGNTAGEWHKGNHRPNIVFDGVEAEKRKLTAMRFSNNYIPQSPINGLCTFDEFNEKIFPIEYIALNKIGIVTDNQINGNVLLALFTTDVASIYLNRTQYTDAGGVRQLGLTDSVIGSSNTLIGNHGCINPESVVFQSSRAYWWDAIKGAWCRYGNDGVTNLSKQYRMKNHYKAISNEIAPHRGNPLQIAPATFDLFHEEMVGSVTNFADKKKNDTIVFNEDNNRFQFSYDFGFQPEFYGKIGQGFSSFFNGQLWLNGAGEFTTTFFGFKQKATVQVVSNADFEAIKTYRAIKVGSQDKWIPTEILTTIRSNDRQSYKTFIQEGEIRDYTEDEACYYADILKSANSKVPYPGLGDRLNGTDTRGVYAITTLTLSDSVTWLTCLYSVSLKYDINTTSI